MLIKRLSHRFMQNLEPFLVENSSLDARSASELVARLASGCLTLEELHVEQARDSSTTRTVAELARRGFISFATAHRADGGQGDDEEPAVRLTPCSRDFVFGPIEPVTEGTWALSRFSYSHVEDGKVVMRNPNADCFLTLGGDAALALAHAFRRPTSAREAAQRFPTPDHGAEVCGALARAGVILRCGDDGKTIDETVPSRRQWAFHDLLFHSLSRLGRTEKEIGGTYRFKGDIPSPPAVKAHSWTEKVIPLPRPDLEALMRFDMPLAAAMELRRSTRSHSIVPLSKQQLGELLFRAVRVRHRYGNGYGDFTSRPYPGGGACYENEFYLTVDACLDVERGFYYYDPVEHALCLVSAPSADTEGLLDEAYLATAMQCRPQVLVTIASRFNRFNWKYASMSYAAQLKNVGVIYQTLYLAATAMNVGACALGMGNADRFARITGLDYLEEGSVGEFMLGRPL